MEMDRAAKCLNDLRPNCTTCGFGCLIMSGHSPGITSEHVSQHLNVLVCVTGPTQREEIKGYYLKWIGDCDWI